MELTPKNKAYEEAMTDAEINAKLAEKVMGFEPILSHPDLFWDEASKHPWYLDSVVKKREALGIHDHNYHWNPLEKIEQAMMVEEEIVEKGLTDQYTDALEEIVAAPGRDRVWDMIHATAQQRCMAALKTIGVEESKQSNDVEREG